VSLRAAVGPVLLLLAAAPGLPAQSSSRSPPPAKPRTALLVGIVADTGKHPIADAEILATRHKLSTITDSRGVFNFTGLEPGDESFLVRHIGYGAQSFGATLAAGDTIRIGVIMAPAPVFLPDVTVEAEGRIYFGKMVGFAERMTHSGAPRSAFITQADIERLNPRRTIDLMLRGGLKYRLSGRGESVTCPRGGGKLAVYLDGAAMSPGFDITWIDPSQIQAMEIYKSDAERPAQFNATGSNCTVVIWTR
jgi:hypothetical protein